MLMVLVWCPACLGWLGGLGSFEFFGKCSGKAISRTGNEPSRAEL